ncbi:MAG: hypothetical protein HYZ44_14500, partial [Bacteroidetes bacterium]|nr:hypothetical protein [Bacteroidota bacterium]
MNRNSISIGSFFVVLLTALTVSTTSWSQVVISTTGVSTTPPSNAVLFLEGNGSQGLVIPVGDRTTVPSPSKGMLIFDNKVNQVYYYNGTTWIAAGGGSGSSLIQISGNTLSVGVGSSSVNLAQSFSTSARGFLYWNGTAWVQAQFNLPTTTQALVYDPSTSTWGFQSLSSGGGEANTASNVGTGGVGIFKQKTGVNLELKNINAASNKVSVTNDAGSNEVDIDINQSNLSIGSSQITGLGSLATLSSISSTEITNNTITGSDLAGNIIINTTGGITAATFTGSAAGLTGFPTFNQNTTGTASTITGSITQSQVVNLTSDLATKQTLLNGTGLVKANGSTISYDNSTYLTSYTEADPVVKSISGIVKSNGTIISAAAAGVDYLTPSGNGSALTNLNASSILSGTIPTARLDVGTTANKIIQLDGTGKLPAVDGSQLFNLSAGTETDPTVKAINGLVKSNGTTIGAAVAGTDYVATETDPSVKAINGLVKSNGTTVGAVVSGTDIKTINSTSLLGAGNISVITTETDPTVKAINGLVKSNGTIISAAAAGVDYLTPSGNGSALTNLNANSILSGTIPTARLDVGNTANKVIQLDGAGKLPAVDGSQLINLPAGTETDPTVKAINGLVKSNGTTISAATAGTDYQLPIILTTTGTTGAATLVGSTLNVPNYSPPSYTAGTGLTLTTNSFSVNTSQNITRLSNLTTNGLVKTNGGSGTLSIATAGTDYLTPTGNGSALTNLNATNISSGIVSITYGGTGAATASSALSNLGGVSNVLPSGAIFVGNASNVASPAPMSGDASISNTGLVTIGTGAITTGKILDGTILDADINATAAIAGSKVNPNFGAQAVSTTGTLSIGSTGQFAIDGAGNITKINNITTSFPAAQGAANTVLTNDGAGNLTWGAGSGWGLTGNAGTNSSTNCIGTTDNDSLTFKVNNQKAGRLEVGLNANVLFG